MSSVRSAIFALIRVALGFGILVYLGYSGTINRRALFGLVSTWRLTLAALVLLWLTVVLTAARLSVLFRPHGFHLPLGLSVRLTLLGSLFNCFLLGSSGGDLVRFLYMTRGNDGCKTELITIGLFDRAVGMFALLLWPLLVAPLFPVLVANPILRKLLWSSGLLALAMVVAVLICFSNLIGDSRAFALLIEKLPRGEYVRRVVHTVRGYRHHVPTLFAALVIALATHTLSITATLFIARATNPTGNLWPACLVIPLGFLVNTVPLSPGGLGVGEAAFNALFSLVQLTGGADALLGWRLLTIITSLPGLAVYVQGHGRFVTSAKKFVSFEVAQSELD